MTSTNRTASASPGPRQPLIPRVFPPDGFEEIDGSIKVEEETLPFYRAELFYPVRIGEVFRDRYQVVAKLGYGASSTAWLCHDLSDGRYVVLKAHVNSVPHNQELEVMRHLQGIDSDHGGREFIRVLEDHFEVQGPHGTHDFFVFPPLGLSVRALQDVQRGGVYPEDIAVSAVQTALVGLDFLHIEANVIHTDVHSGNLLVDITDESLLARFEENEVARPTPRKLAGDRVIHVSQMLLAAPGVPKLCDLGQARICVDDEPQRGSAMPVQYRAPEILLDMPWDYSVDLWSVGLLAWDLVEAKSLFHIYTEGDDDINEAFHLAHMVAILGPPPPEFLKRSAKSLKYWDEAGKWRGVVPMPPPARLESLAKSLHGDAKAQFLDFIRGLLRWVPEERLSTGYAYKHPWLFKLQDAEKPE